jgi:hypothetical protein
VIATALTLCLFVPGCGKKARLTTTNYAKIYIGMPVEEVRSVLGKGEELEPTPRERPSGSSVGAAAGINMPAPDPEAPKLLPGITFAPEAKVMQWEEGKKTVQIMFVNGKVRVKEKDGF